MLFPWDNYIGGRDGAAFHRACVLLSRPHRVAKVEGTGQTQYANRAGSVQTPEARPHP